MKNTTVQLNWLDLLGLHFNGLHIACEMQRCVQTAHPTLGHKSIQTYMHISAVGNSFWVPKSTTKAMVSITSKSSVQVFLETYTVSPDTCASC